MCSHLVLGQTLQNSLDRPGTDAAILPNTCEQDSQCNNTGEVLPWWRVRGNSVTRVAQKWQWPHVPTWGGAERNSCHHSRAVVSVAWQQLEVAAASTCCSCPRHLVALLHFGCEACCALRRMPLWHLSQQVPTDIWLEDKPAIRINCSKALPKEGVATPICNGL